MTDINFYVSKQDGLEHQLNIAYKLIGHALRRQLFIHIHTNGEDMSKHIDNWLWTADKASFLPHRIITGPANNIESSDAGNDQDRHEVKEIITISHDHDPMENCDYLINLSGQRPSFFSRFKKLAEILDNNKDTLTAGRKRYAFYRDRGYTLAYHKL